MYFLFFNVIMLFMISANWQQLKWPSVEWINKLCHIHRIEYYYVIERNDLLIHITN